MMGLRPHLKYCYKIMYTYKIDIRGNIIRNDGALIPADTGNTDYQKYLAWVTAGNKAPVDIPNKGVKQDAQWELIKSERDRRTQNGGYAVKLANGSTKWFQSDPFSRVQQLGLARRADIQIAAGAKPTDVLLDPNTKQETVWKVLDGSFVPLCVADGQAIFFAAGTSDQNIFAYAEVLRAKMMAAADPATVPIYTGWPKIYGE